MTPACSCVEAEGWAAARDHRAVQARLITQGWAVCGVGDWAVTLRCPDGQSVARVAPFDPAYPAFVELCRRAAGSPYLPQIHADVALDGGGQLTVMEFLPEVSAEVATRVRQSWDADDDPLLAQVRRLAEEVNAEAARRRPWWDQIDMNDGNIRRSSSGHPVLIDLFCVDGAAIYAALLRDPAELARRIPEAERRHLAEIAYISRTSTPEEIAALRAAVDALG